MPKKNKKINRLKTFVQKYMHMPWPVLLVGLVLAIIIGYNLVYVPIVKLVERRNYEQATTMLRNLTDEFVANIGKPDMNDEKKACNYTSAKFQKGDLYCYTLINSTYLINNSADSNLLISKVSAIIGPDDVKYISGREDFSDIDTSLEQHAEQRINNDQKNCGAYYTYSKDGNEYRFSVSLSCKGRPKTEIYPLEQ